MKIKIKIKIKLLFLNLFLTCGLGIFAQNIPEPMYPYRLVNDFAGIFSPAETDALEQKLLAYNDSTSTQIYVVAVTDLDGYAASDYAFALGEKWGIGQADKDNGLVILIKPKIGNSRGQTFIAVGYGLETSLNDAFIGRMIRDKMVPYFQDNDYFGGVNAAVDTVIDRLWGKFDAESESIGELPFWVVLLVLFVLFIAISAMVNKGDQHIDSDGHRRGGGMPIFPSSSGRQISSWGGGFGSRGGFGGGGGGSFGGGGAGGSW